MKTEYTSLTKLYDHVVNSDASVISFDCFDTLFWRKVALPVDVFTTIGPEVDLQSRVQAEQKARIKKNICHSHSEITIAEIYQEIFPYANPAELEIYIQKEIAAEIKAGFLHEPTISLLKAAKAKKARTIIVSDIYFNKQHIRHIINTLSTEVSDLIDDIYCSSEYGLSKTTGLWEYILNKENINASKLIHIGDNMAADYVSPHKLGINAIHFRHTHDEIKKIQIQRENVAALIFPTMRSVMPVPLLWHGWYSEHVDDETSVEKMIGWSVLGPTLRSFVRKIYQHYQTRERSKIVFMMRDGFMPQAAFKKLYPYIETYTLNISRMTSIRASFDSRKSIVNYLANTFNNMIFENENHGVTEGMIKLLAKHLGLDPLIVKSIKTFLNKGTGKVHELIEIILSERITRHIIDESTKFRHKLKKHIIKNTDLQSGDHLLLIDLGYEGTTQNLLQNILQDELMVTMDGCYMITAYTPEWKRSRTGMINPDNIDYRSIKALTNHIAIYESLCSSHKKSTIDYAENGDPIGEETTMNIHHLSIIKNIQEEALFFLESTALTTQYDINTEITSSVIDLLRFIYFPTEAEIHCFNDMQFDINLGSNQSALLYDINKHTQNMRKFGPILLAGNDANNNTNAPTQLRYDNIEQSISLLSSYRYGLKWPLNDATYRKKVFDILYIDNSNVIKKTLTAMHTYEGCYSAYFPIVTREVVLQLDSHVSAMEIISVTRIKNTHVYKVYEDYQAQKLELDADWFVDGASISGNLITYTSSTPMLYFKPRNLMSNEVIHFVFRPIINSLN